jgi:methylaspartate mutase epsilon subunit
MKHTQITIDEFFKIRNEVLPTWSTGREVAVIDDGIAYQKALPATKNFAQALMLADKAKKVLLQPRAGVALVDEHIKLLQFLEPECDLLPTTIDAYTRHNKYDDAQKGIARSLDAGYSLLNGFPAVNYGVKGCKRVIENLNKPLQVRHGTPDARLLAEISLASGFTAFEGGGISYNIPYAKNVSLEKSIRDWQYVDRLIGYYEEQGVRINREPFGPLSGTLVPPFISHVVAIIEGLLALEQGAKSITLGYGQLGNLVQDVAAIISLKELAHEYFKMYGFNDYELSTVFHQWMGGFPENEANAFAVISWGGAVAALSGATKVIVKTPHEARGIPTKEANAQGLKATRQIVNMLADQIMPESKAVTQEVELIKQEVRTVLKQVFALGDSDVAQSAVRAFAAGLIDVPFAPAVCNRGKMMPIRDNDGAIRIFEFGAVPLTAEIKALHQEKIAIRARAENRAPSFQMVIDDVYAISKGRLVGRPKKSN